MLKLQIQLIKYSVKSHIEAKAKQRWYYSMLPSNLIKGFTLAEVLITLLIIGVVASLVIPALIANTQDAELKTAWKKIYSTLSQADMRIIQDNGSTFKGLCSDWNHNCLTNLFLPYFSYIKFCPSTTGNGICWHNLHVIKTMDGTIADGNVWYSDDSSYGSMVLNDGVLLRFINYRSLCSNYTMGSLPNICGYIEADVNGFKGPNKIGKDVFMVHIMENGIKPYGYNDGQQNYCASGSGMGCSKQYLY